MSVFGLRLSIGIVNEFLDAYLPMPGVSPRLSKTVQLGQLVEYLCGRSLLKSD